MTKWIKGLLKASLILGICGVILFTYVCIRSGGLPALTSNYPSIFYQNDHHEKKNYTFENIHHFDFDIDIGSVEIKETDDASFQVECLLMEGVNSTIINEKDTLTIRIQTPHHFNVHEEQQKITVYVPKHTLLTTADIHLALGSLKIEDQSFEQLLIHADLGDVELKDVRHSGADIELNLGSLEFEGSFENQFKIYNALGDVDIKLKQSQSEIGLDLHVDMGEIHINDHKAVEMNGDFILNEHAAHHIIADLNLGSMDIEFKH